MNGGFLQAYSAMAWPLFPCSHKNKAPLTPHGFKDATTDLEQLISWFEQFPDCAWGTPTSAERGVLDTDPRNGGDKALADLIARHGPLPPTPRVRTGGGGFHHWVQFPPGTRSGVIVEGIDRKADGGYVIVPPSRVAIPEHEGRSYVWEARPWESATAVAPAWSLASKPKPLAGAAADDPWVVRPAGDDLLTHPGAASKKFGGTEGRPNVLCRLVGVHLARGDGERTIFQLVEAWASRCTPPLERHEWEPHVRGIINKEKGKQKAVRIAGETTRAPHLAPFEQPDVGDGERTRQETNSVVEAGGGLVSWQSDETGNEPVKGPGPVSSTWPTLSPEARHGLLGEMLDAIEPETEADPAAILLGFLTCFGSCVGRGAWVPVGADDHHPAIFAGTVGKTSAAKGVAWGVAKWPFARADPGWAETCICSGVGSGQGLIERVRDERRSMKAGKDGIVKEAIIPAATDKRCLLRLDELATCFKLQRSESSTLGETLLGAWGGVPLEVPNRGDNALSASGYAISVYGDTQPGTIRKLLEKGLEQHNGWMNRFLWCAVRSNRDLPGGGDIKVLEPFLERLGEALQYAKAAGAVLRNAEAEAMWHEVYGTLKRSGDSVPHTDRARPQVLRLSLLYALADQSPVIRADHLRAALAIWGYCRDSARMIFGGQVQPQEPDPLWLQLLNAIHAKPGVKRGELTERFKHRGNAEAVGEGLGHLEINGLAYRQELQPEGGGRPAECWYPSGNSDDTRRQPDPEKDVADPWVVGPDAPEERSRQETNSTPPTGTPEETVGQETNSGQPVEGDSFLADAGKETNSTQPTGVSFLADAPVAGSKPEANSAPLGGDSFLADVPKEEAVAEIGEREAGAVSSEMPVTVPQPKAAVPTVEEVIQECFKGDPTPKDRAWAGGYVNAQIEYEAELRRRCGEDEPPMSEEEFIGTLRAMR